MHAELIQAGLTNQEATTVIGRFPSQVVAGIYEMLTGHGQDAALAMKAALPLLSIGQNFDAVRAAIMSLLPKVHVPGPPGTEGHKGPEGPPGEPVEMTFEAGSREEALEVPPPAKKGRR